MRNAGLAALITCLIALPAWAAQTRPVVVELFTSEGCNSCPPADEVLSDLAASRSDVLPLAFHITYWDRLGWPDPFALEAATQRQRDYAALLQSDSIYTPQMVIDGVHDVVGSDQRGVLAAINRQFRAAAAAVPVSLARDGKTVKVSIGAGAPAAASVLIAGFDSQHTTAVRHGENAGKTLVESNIVRGLVRAGEWHGDAAAFQAALPAGEHLAALLQASDGHILGAARLN